ncbi:MAG: TIGR02281 family clan AA aspartic protease [Rhodobacteraceae bacterium]|nr:TIGR02281 family clan AA aspartic protease [Paracoccaceae bacterium]
MNEPDLGRLVYLGILGAVLVVWFLVHNRQSLGKLAQAAIAWALIFVGVIAAYGLWDDIRQTVLPRQTFVSVDQVEVPRAADGHFYLTLMVNDVSVDFLVDTGATHLVLTQADAARIGLNPDDLRFTGRAMTANGEVRTAPVRLARVDLGEISDRNIRAWVNQGALEQSLLGMSYLQRWSKIEITSKGLLLTR